MPLTDKQKESLTDFGLNTISSGIGGLMNLGFGMMGTNHNAALNYHYQELAAQNADRRTRALYEDYMSPAARMKQLKEAGLSPSLFADGAGGGSMGMTQGAQGGGATGVGLPTGLMTPQSAAEVELIKAQTKKTDAEANVINGENERGKAEISLLQKQVQKTINETNNIGLQNAYMEYENARQAIRLGYDASTWEKNVEMLFKEGEILEHRARSAKVKADIDEHTQTDVEKMVHENLRNTIADTLLKRANAELASKNVALTEQQVQDLISQIENRGKQTQINRDTLNQTIKEWSLKNGLIFDKNANTGDYWQKVIFGEHSHDLMVEIFKALAK